ncbi:MAG TPA: hypothetical protein VEH54_01685 [Steroidobacteraceae bacterium]|nr:hypothetical protein [Steroidobacteraceae bacterium]
MLLSQLQQLIGGIYDVHVGHDVYEFLVTDQARLPQGVRPAQVEEQLIVEQPAAGSGEVALALYLDPALLARLARENPLVRLHEGNVADCWTALEGVSHFLYLAWNAHHDRAVSLLELEMQAEVDKYIASYYLLRRQLPAHFPKELHRVLFARTRLDPRLGDEAAALYREASRYAERFCGRLEKALAPTRGGRRGAREERAVLAELRRFYRLTTARKRAHIERTS